MALNTFFFATIEPFFLILSVIGHWNVQSWTEVLSYIVVNKYKTTPSFTCDPFIVYNYVAK